MVTLILGWDSWNDLCTIAGPFDPETTTGGYYDYVDGLFFVDYNDGTSHCDMPEIALLHWGHLFREGDILHITDGGVILTPAPLPYLLIGQI